MFKFYVLFFLVSIAFAFSAQAQITIRSITIKGNNKTKSYIIQRELPYHIGSLVPSDSLEAYNTLGQYQIFNTSLFNEAKVESIMVDSTTADVLIHVKERWYLFPLPYFRWVDRNFSQWWNQQNRSLERVNYGINFRQSNFTGNNDRLVIGLITGYTHQAILRYQIPFIDKKLQWGVGAGMQYYTQKEMNFATISDKQVFYKSDRDLREGIRANVNISYRPNLFERFNLQIGLGEEQMSAEAFVKAPSLLPTLNKSMRYADFTLGFSKMKFDYNAYPTKGSSTDIAWYQRWAKNAPFSSFQIRKVLVHPFNKSNFLYTESNSQLKFLSNQNYMDQKLLGYGSMQMSGLEYYVVDGNAASIGKIAFHHKIGTITLRNPVTKKFLPEVKYHFWLKLYTNFGYVYSEKPLNANKLSNTLLRTAGIGVDIISIYDFVLKVDYSVNQLGDKGLYLHGGINF
jgi:outer membrane protein assembly factor BamA